MEEAKDVKPTDTPAVVAVIPTPVPPVASPPLAPSGDVRVTKPEDWPAATEVRKTFLLDTLSDAGTLAFNLRAMSHTELRAVEEQLPLPEAPILKTRGEIEERDYQNMDYQAQFAAVQFGRWIMWLDKCWKPLPGTTHEEKVQWAEANLWRNGEITKLVDELRKLSGLNTGKAAISIAVHPQEPKEADPDTWAKSTQTRRVAFHIKHETHTLVFDMAGLSQARVNKIRDECRPPAPPMRPEVHKLTRKPIPGSEKLDYTDPAYRAALAEAELYENCMLLEAALFPFPGNTKEEKRKWLEARPAYEVSALLQHLANNVTSYRERADFM